MFKRHRRHQKKHTLLLCSFTFRALGELAGRCMYIRTGSMGGWTSCFCRLSPMPSRIWPEAKWALLRSLGDKAPSESGRAPIDLLV